MASLTWPIPSGFPRHYNWRGKSFEISIWDGENKNPDGSPRSGEFERMLDKRAENLIYSSEGWEDPPFVTFGDDGPVIPRGGGVVYRATYVNETDQVISAGPHAATEERSDVFLYFYPGPIDGRTYSFPLPVQQ